MEGSNKRPDNSTRQDVLPDQSAVGQHARIGALFVSRRVERGMEGTEQKELESPKREIPAAQKKNRTWTTGSPLEIRVRAPGSHSQGLADSANKTPHSSAGESALTRSSRLGTLINHLRIHSPALRIDGFRTCLDRLKYLYLLRPILADEKLSFLRFLKAIDLSFGVSAADWFPGVPFYRDLRVKWVACTNDTSIGQVPCI